MLWPDPQARPLEGTVPCQDSGSLEVEEGTAGGRQHDQGPEESLQAHCEEQGSAQWEVS